MATVGINGFGRIGKMCLRACLEKHIEVKLINDPLVSPEYMIYLLTHDSTHGLHRLVWQLENNCIVSGEIRIATSREKNPNDIPWRSMGATYVIETTGTLTTVENANKHTDGGAKKVIVTAPCENAPILIFGVNHTCYNPRTHEIVSVASSTTNCAAPIVKIIHDNFEILQAMITSIQALTIKQYTLDGVLEEPQSILARRDGRSALQNIIPASTDAYTSLMDVFPQLVYKISAMAFRVPIPDVSLCDMTFRVNAPITYETMKKVMKEASNGYLRGVLGYTEDDCVSSDFTSTTYSCVFDAKASILHNSTFIKIVAWYDNETGYAHRVADLIEYMHNADTGNVPVPGQAIEYGDC